MSVLIHETAAMQQTMEDQRRAGRRIAVVPTMGALHEGHLSLIRMARENADVVVTTVFVNPAQFGPREDFEKYPRDIGRDSTLATSAGTDYVYAPAVNSLYPEGYRTYVEVENLSTVLEGRFRPGHFRGVATIVVKLLNITKPHVAVFGQKDAQQVVIIRRAVDDLNIDVEIVVGPTVRESDGLAMSSRNAYLTQEQRAQAPVLYQALLLGERRLRDGKPCAQVIEELTAFITRRSAAALDYISVADGNTLEELAAPQEGRPILLSLAARFDSTRLIDNITLTL
jgi:pantoate--beta-alanine ligase